MKRNEKIEASPALPQGRPRHRQSPGPDNSGDVHAAGRGVPSFVPTTVPYGVLPAFDELRATHS